MFPPVRTYFTGNSAADVRETPAAHTANPPLSYQENGGCFFLYPGRLPLPAGHGKAAYAP